MAEPGTGNKADSAGRSVLVVDSDPQSLVFMCMIIQRFDYQAISALGVGNALEIAGDSPPAVIITELNLKGLSGLDLLQRLRQKPGTAAVPVVIMTRELTPGLEKQCRDTGAAACLEKPIKVNALYRAIHPIVEPGSRRQDIRIQTRLSVSVNGRPLDCVDGECATNLSVNGIYLRALRPYPVNSQVILDLQLSEQQISTEARVVYCQGLEQVQAGMWGIGLQFIKTFPEAPEIIRRFITDEVTHGMGADWE